jgi:hypothetical protein
VLEGVPLDIYLDLEGSRLTNSDVDFDAVYASLMQEFEMFLKQMRITGADLPATIVVLDSSNAKKFSKHVIYRLKESVFANNYICGALMRNFHLHLLRRYGPPETNKFYINPEEAAVKKNVKKCLLDFAVYTKNRDFRLVGSCKRKDCSTANPIRWLWMEGQPNVLNQDIVMSSLIQRCNRPIRYHIAKVIDTLNGGIPFSSSLSTAHKTNHQQRDHQQRDHQRDQRDQRDQRVNQPISTTRLNVIGENIAKWILTAFPNYFRDVGEPRFNVKVLEVNVGEVTVKINFPNVYYCQSRLKKTGQPNHKTNSICFMVNSSSGSIYQMCASNTCTTNGKRDYTYHDIRLPKFILDQFEEVLGPIPNEAECLFIDEEDEL